MQLKMAIINLALGILLIFLIVKMVGVWQEKKFLPEAIPAEKLQDANVSQTTLERRLPSEKAFDDIVEKNLFSPERREYIPPAPEEVPVEEVVEKKISGKRIALYGVMIWKESRSALIDNPVSGRGQPKYLWVKKGENIGKLTVMDIEREHVLIRQGNEKYKIMLNDKENKSIASDVGGEAENSTANVVVTGTEEKSSSKTSVGEKKQTGTRDGFETVKTPFGSMQIRKK